MNITFLINAHREGLLLHSALRSVRSAHEICSRPGLSLDVILVADRPDQATRAVIEAWSDWLDRVEFVDYGNLGASRMHGIDRARGEFLCFLDGDDLWQPEWPSLAYAKADKERGSGDTVYHTEIFATFGSECSLREQIASEDPLFHPNHLVGGWHYCNNLFASRDVFARYPIQPYDHGRGFGSEDWHWSCETLHAGVRRSWVPGTVYFYRRDPSRPGLGQSPWLVVRETSLFQTDVRVPAYADFLPVRGASGPLLQEYNAIRRYRAPPPWLTEGVETACQIDPDLWSLREGLPTLRVETPPLHVIVAAAFGEMRRLYDECGRFGIVVIQADGREPGGFGKLLRTVSRAAGKQPLVVGLDRPVHGDQPICREGKLLYLDISFIFEACGSLAYPLRQLFITCIVQLKPLFFFSVEHWLGESLSPYRVPIAESGTRFGYIGTCMVDPLALRAVLARVQNGAAWYNEIWFAVSRDQEDQLGALQASTGATLIGVTDREISAILEAAIDNDRTGASCVRELSATTPQPKSIAQTLQAQVTCVLNTHREQEILLPTLSSISRMLAFTGRMNVPAELVIVCDDSDSQTRTAVSRFATTSGIPTTVIDVQLRDLGAARNAGIAAATGEFVCILDADDLYSENWVIGALAAISEADRLNTVVHPALNVYFGREYRYFKHPVWNSPGVPRTGLLFENYWTSLSFARTSLYRDVPFASVDATTGFGFEDWHWNMQVLDDGGDHIIARRTCHFIRLKERGSLSQDAANRRCLIRPSTFVRGLIRS